MQSEIKLQSMCFLWHWNNYPDERGLLCYNLNNSANKIQGNQNKALGLIKGRSDMVYYKNGKAVMLEFKTETGTQSIEQKKWQEKIENQGFEYYLVRSLKQFQEIICKQ
jgi:glutathionylspermidine synthase